MRKHVLPFLLIISLCLAGCAALESSVPLNQEESLPDAAESEADAEDAAWTETEEASAPLQAGSGIVITDLTDSSSFYAEDDASACIMTVSSCCPKIAIAGKPEASQNINDAISQELDTFWTFEKDNVGYAEENRKISLENTGSEPEPYTADFSYTLKRCDERIISFVFTQTDYTGGTHGNYWSYGMTFDTATGTRIYLGGLSGDSNSFFRILTDELNVQASLPAYEMYIDKNIMASMEETFLNDSSCWYLDRSGLSFISNPYVLGSYAAGTFEFNIPYEKLNGLKAEYTYEGNYIQKIFPGISLQHDLNSNGTTDEICYSVAWDEDFSNPRPILTINGTDFSGEFEKLYMTNPLADAYYLIDVDPGDPYIEIAVTNQSPENPNSDCTHFFRYNTGKELIYQGKISGIFHDTMQICYNSNGNLVLRDPNEISDES